MTCPLDGNPAAYAPAETKPDLTKPSLAALAWVLENIPESPAPDWQWDFAIVENGCGTAGCAMGIADRIWPHEAYVLYSMAGAASIYIAGLKDRGITARVVAGRIRDHLAGRPIRYLVEGDRS